MITAVLREFEISNLIFVDQYQFAKEQEREMMAQATSDISHSDLFVAEISEKAIGVGVEAGYAKGLGVPIIYLRKYDAEHSTTVAGISDFTIVYSDIEDLGNQMRETLRRITFSLKP